MKKLKVNWSLLVSMVLAFIIAMKFLFIPLISVFSFVFGYENWETAVYSIMQTEKTYLLYQMLPFSLFAASIIFNFNNLFYFDGY